VVEFAPRRLDRLDDIVADRVRRLTAYQDGAYAERYRALVERARAKDETLGAGGRLARAVARSYYKLLANKDEFEVARLFSLPEFRRQIETQFEGDYRLHFHFGAWPFGQRDPSGSVRKREVGPWALRAMKMLQHLRRFRGTWLDPFRNTSERKLARELLKQYEDDVAYIVEHAMPVKEAVELANLPEKIRGYGYVRERHANAVTNERATLRQSVERTRAAA
jgi:indolepyruvate ferredoxin oxidoreductase